MNVMSPHEFDRSILQICFNCNQALINELVDVSFSFEEYSVICYEGSQRFVISSANEVQPYVITNLTSLCSSSSSSSWRRQLSCSSFTTLVLCEVNMRQPCLQVFVRTKTGVGLPLWLRAEDAEHEHEHLCSISLVSCHLFTAATSQRHQISPQNIHCLNKEQVKG